jgi:hypothetical protein
MILTFALLCLLHGAVTRCEPELPQRSALEQQLLGAKPNFGGFVRAMRQRFKLLVATPSQQSPAAAATAAE